MSIRAILTTKLYLMQTFFCQFFSSYFLLSTLLIRILLILALIAIKCTNLNCLENMDGSEVMHRLWNRDVASVLNFRHILNNLRYDGTIPVRFTRVIRIGRIRRQAEQDLQEGRRLRQRLTRIQRR
ncbi:hypothetical protein PHYBLDRAFT_171758 [Phycomyces blakesleeanus NRRL 1555(-)]|uniref:Uncharacterized protein n=1 Tax=Phycomyces blakesleeanus (strain ATCC 8743b / DSM 1359 / FGSC 10004 / NBRC 33097 / NRRL 1555) TaxID=763407 RepID=A0A163DCC6_PHYB8|nr:hypothetical protein PHYBLDRAFT_171758 [Phycomyces blakesleeanus NRRL 1555(-)]OAD70380.1 hypothetical protein PHYBLDRAFT_171758 [Phycomyces blakesleeanus NRRL 1555(-)]|eukprot:XP_018288420.1 hypothetical protein PHYBLDRAFT_171758 [Phycomyces blakesleeanus NRRL 1555(-)]